MTSDPLPLPSPLDRYFRSSLFNVIEVGRGISLLYKNNYNL